MAITLPQGFRAAGLHCGIKGDTSKNDLALVFSDRDAVAAGVYTQNQVFAAPVAYDQARTPNDQTRVVVVNSGNANACTGARGDSDAEEMARRAAEACGVRPDQALVMSTGLIGAFLPMDEIRSGITQAAGQLADDEDALVAAARGMMTTDTVHKLAGRTLTLGKREVKITGLAKGAAMIGPNMATMLGLVLTDAVLTPETAQKALREAVDDSFNCISVDGHMSTNDTVLLLAGGGKPLADDQLTEFTGALRDVCIELARAIIADGEGASHRITIDVEGCKSRADAHRIAKTVAESALVKTAVAGADPNWGRIVSAAGYSGAALDPARVDLEVNGHLLYRHGSPATFDAETVSESIRAERETSIVLRVGDGPASVRFWTTDLTAEYVRLNADYTT